MSCFPWIAVVTHTAGMINQRATIAQLHLAKVFRRLVPDLHGKFMRVKRIRITASCQSIAGSHGASIGCASGSIVGVQPINFAEQLASNAILRAACFVEHEPASDRIALFFEHVVHAAESA